jgi:copper resistance protein C
MSLSRPAALLAALLLTALGGLTLTAAPASAHASLIGANPEDGATVQRPPTEVSLEFSEEISEPAFISVTTADGLDVTGGRVAVDGATVTRPLAAAAAAGEYTIAYRVVSADGHPIEGETTFTASRPAAAPKASTQPGDGGGATEPTPTDESSEAAPSDDPTTAETEPAASQTDESDEGGVSPTVVVVGVVVLVAVVTLLMLARRRGNR